MIQTLSAPPKKILVIEDDPVTVRLLEARFRANGYEVIKAADGASGLAKAQTEAPDLITLDIMLPEVNGYSICGFLKGNTDYADIPIIMVTTRDKEEDKAFDEDVQPEAYFTKPFDMRILLEKVRELIG